MKFIYTQDLRIRDKLLADGHKLIKSFGNGIYVFENSPKIVFSKDDLPRVVYSNVVFIGGEI